MKIAILGSNSAIANELSNLLIETHEIIKYSSKDSNENYFNIFEKFDSKSLNDFDLILYFSWITFPRNLVTTQANIEAFRNISEFAKRKGIKVIFISSLSARKDSNSLYGYSKFECEMISKQNNQTALRLGTILKNKKFSGSLNYLSSIKNKIPFSLKFSSDLLVPCVSIDYVSEKIKEIIELNIQGIYEVPYKLISFNDIIYAKKNIKITVSNNLFSFLLKYLSKISGLIKSINDSWISINEFNQLNAKKNHAD